MRLVSDFLHSTHTNTGMLHRLLADIMNYTWAECFKSTEMLKWFIS